MNPDLHYDYTTVGHVTVDVLADGSRRPGGTAFYSALQAARLGCRALVVTQGVPAEIEELLAPYSAELELRVRPAAATTTLLTRGAGSARKQRMLAWAGPMAGEVAADTADTAILHLAPVARECEHAWSASAGFVGLTAQGLARQWRDPDGEITAAPAHDAALQIASHCDALVVSEHERGSCEALIGEAVAAGAVAAITAGAAPTSIVLAGGRTLALAVPSVKDARDDLGAGDVFAAAFFVALAGGSCPARAGAFATAAAAVRMQGCGAGAIGDRSAIAARLDAVARATADARPASGSGA